MTEISKKWLDEFAQEMKEKNSKTYDKCNTVYQNLSKYQAYDYESYHLRKDEADICIEALSWYMKYLHQSSDIASNLVNQRT